MTKRLLGIILVVLFGTQFQPLASASTLQLEAPKVFAQSVTHDLRFSEQGGELSQLPTLRGEPVQPVRIIDAERDRVGIRPLNET